MRIPTVVAEVVGAQVPLDKTLKPQAQATPTTPATAAVEATV
jgi:hypothetical protein